MQHVAEPREAHLRFELRADSPNDACPNSLCPPSGNVEQHRLADSGVTRQQQRATIDARLVDEHPQLFQLAIAAKQQRLDTTD